MYQLLNFFISNTRKERRPRRSPETDLHKYKETVIYEIRSIKYPEIFYIGHTISPNTRFHQHIKEASDGKSHSLKSRYMRLIGVNNFKFRILLKFSCNNRAEAEAVEARYIKRYLPTMNTEFVIRARKKLNEEKYMQFARKIEFSPLYYIVYELLKSFNLIS
jgi:hypothetical protein